MKPEQYERLPELARSIVDIDREIRATRDEMRANGLISASTRFYRELQGRRAELSRAADQTWGAPLRGDRSTRS